MSNLERRILSLEAAIEGADNTFDNTVRDLIVAYRAKCDHCLRMQDRLDALMNAKPQEVYP